VTPEREDMSDMVGTSSDATVTDPTDEAALPSPLPAAAPRRKGAFRRLLRNPGFRRLWISQFVSNIGDWMLVGLLIPLVNSMSGGSSFAVAGILIAKIFPALFLSSLTGVFVDHFDRRKVMIATDIARAVLVLGVIVTNNLAIIYLIVLLMETASLLFVPAKNALIPYLVHEDELAEANALSYTTGQASTIIGLTASAAILAAFERVVRLLLGVNFLGISRAVGVLSPALLGPRAGVIVDSLTFVVSAISIYGIKIAAKSLAADGAPLDLSLVGKDVRESFVFMREHKELRGLLTTIFLAILGGGAVATVGLVYIQTYLTGAIPIIGRIPALRALTATPQTLFLLLLAIGMVSAAVVVPRLMHLLRLQLIFVGSVALFGAGMFLFSLTTHYWVAALFAVVAGACIATVTVAGNTYVAQTIGDEIRGRVFTALESVIKVALLLSLFVMSPLNDLVALAIGAIAEAQNIPAADIGIWAPRVTLWLASAIVLGAAYYGFRTLSWKGGLPPEVVSNDVR